MHMDVDNCIKSQSLQVDGTCGRKRKHGRKYWRPISRSCALQWWPCCTQEDPSSTAERIFKITLNKLTPILSAPSTVLPTFHPLIPINSFITWEQDRHILLPMAFSVLFLPIPTVSTNHLLSGTSLFSLYCLSSSTPCLPSMSLHNYCNSYHQVPPTFHSIIFYSHLT